jgi:general secretion pathway protein D
MMWNREMKDYFRTAFHILLLLNVFYFPLAHATAVKNENTTSRKSDTRLWNLTNVNIHTLINEIALETGKNFVVSPQVTGNVTFISSYALTNQELYQAFLALLEVSGFDAISDGAVTKIIPEAFSKEEGAPVLTVNQVKSTDEIAVTVVRVKYGSATDLVKVLKQLVFHFGYMETYAPTNDIIISDRANNISRLLKLIHRLDKPSAISIDVIHLKYAQAADIVSNVSSLLQQKGEVTSGLTLAADDRSNDVLLHGGTPEQYLQIRSLISQLDVPLNTKSVNTEVIYLKYLRAEKFAVILNGFIENYIKEKGGRVTSSSARFTAPNLYSGPEKSESAQLNNSTQNPLINTGQNSAQNAGSNSASGVDFSNMTQKQPKSGSVSAFVQWEESTNAVIVSVPADLMVKLKSVVAKLDIRRPQVLIEAVIAEIEVDRANELGIELNTGGKIQILTRFNSTLPLSGTGNDNNVAISNPPVADAVGQGLTGAYFAGNNLRLLLRALESDSRSNILSTPNIVTLDNEPAQIKVGQKISFAVGQIQNNPTGGNPFNFYNQQDVGLILTINPQITPDGAIKLIIEQELSNVLPGQVSAGSNPNLSERFIHTTVMANDGEVLVLGGLIQNEWQEITSKVPVLGDIPLLGLLFRSHEKQLTKQNLMIFLRPTILYEDKNTVHVVGSKYENLRQQQLETQQEINVANKMTSPVLPVWGKTADLPPPFSSSQKVDSMTG